MGTESTEDLWALVFCGNKMYIGVVGHYIMEGKDQEKLDVLNDMTVGRPVVVNPGYEITVQMIPVGRGPGGQVIVSKNISGEPILLNFEEAPLHIMATSLMFLDDMKPSDCARYKRLAEEAARQSMEARAASAGIVPPER